MRRSPLLVAALALALALPAFANTYVVTTTADGADAVPGDDDCDDGTGQCTLRAAVMEANAHGGDDDIVLPAGLYTLTLKRDTDLPDEETGDLDVTEDLEIVGAGNGIPCAGVGCSCIDGKKGKDRVFDVAPGVELRLEMMIVKNGKAQKGDFNPIQFEEISGGLVRVAGRLETDHVVMERGSSPDDGGCVGFVNGAEGDLVDTFIYGCKAKDGGGAIEADGADLDLDRVTLAYSKAGDGGGVELSGGEADFDNVTVSQNKAKEGGGVDAEDGADLELNNTSLVNNKSKVGAALNNDEDSAFLVAVRNSFFRTQGKENNCAGTITSQGGNLENGTLCGFTFVGGDCPDCDPDVDDDLADNGGAVPTHAIGPNSQAINLGNDASCEGTDARGAARVGGCDAGSFEFGGVVP